MASKIDYLSSKKKKKRKQQQNVGEDLCDSAFILYFRGMPLD